jgi:hypothetical protein
MQARNRAVTELLEAIDTLIRERQHDRARSMIAAAHQSLPADQIHRLTALSGKLERRSGNLSGGTDLFRQATRQEPTWLPHWYMLSAYLMNDQLWLEAIEPLTELIALSERSGDPYFLDDARLRKLLCLKALGRDDEIPLEKHNIAPDALVVIDGRFYTLDDLD